MLSVKTLTRNRQSRRQRHADARHPVHDVAPSGLVDLVQEEVAADVDGSPPRPCRDEQRERAGAAHDLRRVHDEEHAEAARPGRGRVAHVPADEWSRPRAPRVSTRKSSGAEEEPVPVDCRDTPGRHGPDRTGSRWRRGPTPGRLC